jgi:hypothetical protein
MDFSIVKVYLLCFQQYLINAQYAGSSNSIYFSIATVSLVINFNQLHQLRPRNFVQLCIFISLLIIISLITFYYNSLDLFLIFLEEWLTLEAMHLNVRTDEELFKFLFVNLVISGLGVLVVTFLM